MFMSILGCVFLVIAIMYGFRCFAGAIYRTDISTAQMFLMAIGIVGSIACFFIF